MAKRQVGALLVFAFLALALGACANARADAPATRGEPQPAAATDAGKSYRETDAAGLAEMLRHKDFELVNVHIPYAGEIPGTDAFVPYDHIEENLARLPADKNARIVLYCRSGMMSDIAAKALVELGYKNIWNLKGGMTAWQEAGNTLIQQPQGASPSAASESSATGPAKVASASLPTESRSSEGGNVTVEVTPAGKAGELLVFSVALNTHMVDLDYDYRAIATLRDDQGNVYPAASWDGGSGGHHVTGKLAFSNGRPVLRPGVKWIELDLKDVAGVPLRTFHWDVTQGDSAQ